MEKNKQIKKKEKVLKLKPSAKDKRRYILINEISNKKVEEAILKYIGELGFAKSAYMYVKLPEIKNKIVGSCLRKELINVKTALSLSGIKVEKVTETLKKLKG
jgi:RNase P/RNase MRP subunit POP5